MLSKYTLNWASSWNHWNFCEEYRTSSMSYCWYSVNYKWEGVVGGFAWIVNCLLKYNYHGKSVSLIQWCYEERDTAIYREQEIHGRNTIWFHMTGT